MIIYTNQLDEVNLKNLNGFFAGWPNPPSNETFIKLLKESDEMIIAYDDTENKVVGFITAITDNVLSAYIPFLEVIESHQNKGIGKELVERMLEKLKGYYMIDVVCDENLKPYYEKFGMKSSPAMIMRNYENQSGRKD